MKIPPTAIYHPLHTIENTTAAPEFEPAVKHTRWLHTIMNDAPQPPVRHEASPSNKGSLAFILAPSTDQHTHYFHGSSASGSDTESEPDARSVAPASMARSPSQSKRRRVSATQPDSEERSRPSSPDKKGSKFCIVEGCTSRAKHARKCWRHGGSVKCKVADCINRAKSKGVCWSHGGGTICSHPQCETIAVSHGFCWAHGGGKRCQVEGCSRPAYERTNNLCTTHHKQNQRKHYLHP